VDAPLFEQPLLADSCETLMVPLLLKRGLDYIQRGCDTEAAALLTLAREQLPPDQGEFAGILDTFLQEYAEYQCTRQAFQEASIHFARIYAEQQARIAIFEKTLFTFVRSLSVPHQSSDQLSEKNGHNPLPSPLESLPVMVLQTSPKENMALPELSITCFGRFEIRRLSQPLVLCSNRNAQAILRYLVAQVGYSAPVEKLLAVVWPEDEPTVAQNKLHIAISALRRSLHVGLTCELGRGYIICKNHVYSLNPAAMIRTDVDEFLHCYQIGQQQCEERVASYERACSLYTGPFLSEDQYADWSFLLREHFSQIYLTMCRVLTEHYLQIQCYEDAAKWAIAILAENCCDEAAYRQLIQVYAAQGRRSEAVQQYHRCKQILHQELGVQPLPETTHLFQTIVADEIPPP
jgi:DNA-binding SARP family transcriptional activator